jgi:hypothetical protein
MKKVYVFLIFTLFFAPVLSSAGLLDDLMKGVGVSPQEGIDDSTAGDGLKEALSIGTANAVKLVSRPDGYFRNEFIKILMPEKIRKVADLLSTVGFQKEVDDFVLSMNRAAEKVAPQAADFFVDAIKEMTILDAHVILKGGDTAATEYFREKTSNRLYGVFKPVVSDSMNEAGVTRSYKEMMGRYESLPFVEAVSLDLDHYVTNQALDGLFYMVGQEEKKIRTDPAARVTDLLKNVFSN